LKAFVKTADPSRLSMFEAEAEGLREIARTRTVRVPEVLRVGIENGRAFIEMERIDRSPSQSADAMLGEQLAQLHRITAPQFGWHRDNTIGLTPQQNTHTASWVEFFRERRLGFQLDLFAANGHDDAAGRSLLDRLEVFFADHKPRPSLLHGDLWGGNWLTATNGEPVIFDPACYYGDREADIAMTYLFGGFGKDFYAAYEAAWPLAPGQVERRELYNLYHMLNHANLFGGVYIQQSINTINKLLRRYS
jgi:fructosamine-3-kinase